MKDPSISVIIPIYNAEDTIRACLDSLIAQTLGHIEILCIDDGSTDGTWAILKEYEARDPRIFLLHQPNAGAGAARNRGLSAARGKYLSFLDADDFFDKDMLRQAFMKAEALGADMVVYGSDRYNQETGEYERVAHAMKKAFIPPYEPFDMRSLAGNVFKTFVGWPWDKLFRRDFVLRCGLSFQEIRTSNDLYFVFGALVMAGRIGVIPDVLVHQRVGNKKSLSHTREKSWGCFFDALKALQLFLAEHGLYEELERDFINYCLHFSLWNLNTLTGRSFRELYEKLQSQWFYEMGIASQEAEFFENREEYLEYREIMEVPFQEFNKKLSVIIPVHNAERYIGECLDSLLSCGGLPTGMARTAGGALSRDEKEEGGDPPGLEIICVDDCSTDATRDILTYYSDRHACIRVLKNEENLYAGRSRNRGLSVARGRYVAFLDADDYVLPGAYASLYTLAVCHDLDFIKTTGEGFDDETGAPIPNRRYSMTSMNPIFDETLLSFQRHPRKFLMDMSVVPWNGIYRRKFLQERDIRFNDLYCVNDRSFYVEVCLKAERVMVTRRFPLVRHRMNNAGSLVGKRMEHFDCQFASYRLMKDICDREGVSSLLRYEILDAELRDIFGWYDKVAAQNTPKEGKLEDQVEESLRFLHNQEVRANAPKFARFKEDLARFLLAEVDMDWFDRYCDGKWKLKKRIMKLVDETGVMDRAKNGAVTMDAYNFAGPARNGYGEASYEEPPYEKPSYEEPSYEEPSYEEPSYEKTPYEEPGHAAGDEGEPEFSKDGHEAQPELNEAGYPDSAGEMSPETVLPENDAGEDALRETSQETGDGALKEAFIKTGNGGEELPAPGTEKISQEEQ